MKTISLILIALLASAASLAQQPGALPFSSAVRAGDFLFVSGNIGIAPPGKDPLTEGMDIAAKSAMDGISQTLKEFGASFADVVKCTVMLRDMAAWERFNLTYVRYFDPGHFPARSAFGAAGLARDALLEVECIAYQPMAKK